MGRPLKTHAAAPSNPKVPLCREYSTGANRPRSGPVVGALNATCVRCQHLLRIAALTPPTTEDTMKQKHIDDAVEAIIVHVARAVAMRIDPNTTPADRIRQATHIAASLDALIVETDGLGPNEGRALIDSAVAKLWPPEVAKP